MAPGQLARAYATKARSSKPRVATISRVPNSPRVNKKLRVVDSASSPRDIDVSNVVNSVPAIDGSPVGNRVIKNQRVVNRPRSMYVPNVVIDGPREIDSPRVIDELRKTDVFSVVDSTSAIDTSNVVFDYSQRVVDNPHLIDVSNVFDSAHVIEIIEGNQESLADTTSIATQVSTNDVKSVTPEIDNTPVMEVLALPETPSNTPHVSINDVKSATRVNPSTPTRVSPSTRRVKWSSLLRHARHGVVSESLNAPRELRILTVEGKNTVNNIPAKT